MLSYSYRGAVSFTATVAVIGLATTPLTTHGDAGKTTASPSQASAATTSLHAGGAQDTRGWRDDERAALFALSLTTLSPLAPDPSNRVADDPAAARLGERLFFDARLSGNGKVSCASCHQPDADFQDGLAQGHGMGQGRKRTMPIAGTAHSAWFFWDGRADSQWAQALGPMENPLEHGTTRTQVALEIASRYTREYTALFGAVPAVQGLQPNAGPMSDAVGRAAWERLGATRQESISRVYSNVGKAIAAYERRVEFGRSRVDDWIDSERSGGRASGPSLLTPDELSGARLFVGRARCATCHTGGRLTDDAFHNTGVAGGRTLDTVLPLDDGRASGVRKALASEFACTGPFSDASTTSASADACAELRFADSTSAGLVGAYKTPSLRNVGRRAPYMDAGQLTTLENVVAHYDRPPRARIGVSELRPLHLSATERMQLVAFLRALDAPPTIRASTTPYEPLVNATSSARK